MANSSSTGDMNIVRALAQFMKKFHLVKKSLTKSEVEFIKQHPGKVLYFQDVEGYLGKIRNTIGK